MIGVLAGSWVVVVETDSEDPAETTLEAHGPFMGQHGREDAQRFAGAQEARADVYSVAVLPLRSIGAEWQPIRVQAAR